jgi:hypothetical protein
VLDCRTFEEQIGEYLEQGLTVPQRRVFCQHLLICSDCRTLLEDIRENLQLCRAAVQPTLAEDDEAAVEKAEVEPGRQVAIRYLPPPVQELSIPRSTIGEMVSCRSFDKLIADYFDSPAVDNLPVASPGSDWPDLSHPQQNFSIVLPVPLSSRGSVKPRPKVTCKTTSRPNSRRASSLRLPVSVSEDPLIHDSIPCHPAADSAHHASPACAGPAVREPGEAG